MTGIVLIQISLPMEERRNFSTLYNKMTLDSVMRLAPNIEWRKLVDHIFMHEIHLQEEFIVKAPTFLTAVDQLLKQTDSR